ncbi:hypothetical protein [Rhodohalobacter halophilus]|uniref:hypothetical protein n=1 Tax=Rhodohalobacter halophilus TaxID=1812810 RepID=UPI00083F97EB|nr:hypothetical protein [Rhodohalobacter halophilus]
MMNELEIEEKYSKFWPLVATISGLVAIVLFTFYLTVDEVLIEGYLRLTAFSFFALTVLSLFKVKDGKVMIQFEKDEDSIAIRYIVRNRLVYEEAFPLSDIEEIKVDQMPNKSLYNDFAKKDRTVRLKKRKSDGWLYLAQLHGRVIPLTENNALKVKDFFISAMEKAKN